MGERRQQTNRQAHKWSASCARAFIEDRWHLLCLDLLLAFSANRGAGRCTCGQPSDPVRCSNRSRVSWGCRATGTGAHSVLCRASGAGSSSAGRRTGGRPDWAGSSRRRGTGRSSAPGLGSAYTEARRPARTARPARCRSRSSARVTCQHTPCSARLQAAHAQLYARCQPLFAMPEESVVKQASVLQSALSCGHLSGFARCQACIWRACAVLGTVCPDLSCGLRHNCR